MVSHGWGAKGFGKIPAEEMVDGRVSFPVSPGYISENGVQFLRKVATAGYTLRFLRRGGVKVGFDQSYGFISCRCTLCTQVCRFSTRVYPVVSLSQNMMYSYTRGPLREHNMVETVLCAIDLSCDRCFNQTIA